MKHPEDYTPEATDMEVFAPDSEEVSKAEIVTETRENLIRDIERLSRLKGSTRRVQAFAKIMDTYGVDALLGLALGVGDVTTSVVSSLYLLAETYHSRGAWTDYVNVLLYQSLDAAMGSVPGVGDVGDFFFRANLMSAKDFETRANALQVQVVADMRKHGMTDAQIETFMEQMTQKTRKLPELVEGVVGLLNKVHKSGGRSFVPRLES